MDKLGRLSFSEAWRSAFPEQEKARKQAWRLIHLDKEKERLRARHEAHREEDREYLISWRKDNPNYMGLYNKVYGIKYRLVNKEKLVAYSANYGANWRKNNPEKARIKDTRYNIARRSAIPRWVNAKEIDKFYAKAIELTRSTGVLHEVDHIWPLNGKGFNGLHVPWNLQILTKTSNAQKSNRSPLEVR